MTLSCQSRRNRNYHCFQYQRGQLKQKLSRFQRRQTTTLASQPYLHQISRSNPISGNIPKHIYTICVTPTPQSNPGQIQQASSSRPSLQSVFPLCATNGNRGRDRYPNTRCSSCCKGSISLRKQTFHSFPGMTAVVTKTQPPIPGPEVEMTLTSEEAIIEWRYIPLHVNPTMAATLAYLSFTAANQNIGFTFGGTIMKYAHVHLTECKRKKPQQQSVERDKDNLMEWTYDFANRPCHSLSDRDAMMTMSRWRYVPLHPDPMTAAVLAHMNFDAANKAAEFSFGEVMMQLGREHLEECISKRAQALRQLQAPQVTPLVTPWNRVCPTTSILPSKVKAGP